MLTARSGPSMAQPEMTRVFLNNVDSYASRHIAQVLSGSVAGAAVNTNSDLEAELLSNHKRTFQVVGTVSHPSAVERPHVVEQYTHLNRDELLSKLMGCDVVIYNVTQHADQVEEALWAASALHSEVEHFSGPKLFILISTIMTWACSKPADPDDLELPFTDAIFWSRRAHPNFERHIDLEKRVVKMGKTERKLFSTYVVAAGLQYGMGEQIFHYFFKKSWLGEDGIPIFGDGKNIVPTIHIHDLASVVYSVIQHQPRPYYLLAVDDSNNTMEEIVKKIASILGPGKIQKKPSEDAFLTKDLSVMEANSLLVSLRMEAAYIKKLFSFNWVCQFGLVENIEVVVQEFRQTRGLLPVRLCVLGAPAVGKTTVSKKICEYYRLHHITVKSTISDTIARLEHAVRNPDPDEGNSTQDVQEQLSMMKERLEQNRGLDEELLLNVMRDKLMTNPCNNQGYVLEDFPQTREQAKELFGGKEEDATSQNSLTNIIPEFVLCLEATEAFLLDRVLNLPESCVQEHNYEPENFSRWLAAYKEKQSEDDMVLNYFYEHDIIPLQFEISSSNEADCLSLMQKVIDIVGQPRNYGPSSQEVKEEERRKAAERLRREAQERAEVERMEADEARDRAAHWAEWTKKLEEVRQQEEEELEATSGPMRDYLMEQVVPTLSRGLIECCRAQPQDPVDFLAEYLLKNNPF
ncbi:adenylate kinase 7 isoform X1 [Oreochromis aureus]|uniref:Nucleoside-diphosphate kinase n=1 Tax=Oreochromis aureus TaxID=47969 RepID=A0AAZ1XNS4_OREAU|nr:adenylate kinase 7 isoform X1 [Oreochromis aureus]